MPHVSADGVSAPVTDTGLGAELLEKTIMSDETGRNRDEIDEEPATGACAGPSGNEGVGSRFRPPDGVIQEEDAAITAVPESLVEMPPFAAVDPRLIEAKAAIDQALAQQVATRNSKPMEISSLRGTDNIQGAGIGNSGARAAPPGSPTLTVYVANTITLDQVKSLLVDALGVRASAAENLPVDVIVTGAIETLGQTLRLRPAPGGSSVSPDDLIVATGTFGSLAYGRTPPRDGRSLMISCNHVLANSNGGSIGDCISQPGMDDNGSCPSDQIAVLERFYPIDFSGAANYVDCATGWCFPDRVRPELLYMRPDGPSYFRMSNTPVPPVCNGAVGMSGRLSGVTLGYVNCLYTSCVVSYPDGRTALYQDQIAIQNPTGSVFAVQGDSGAVVWTWDSSVSPIGLLFSGSSSSGIAFANKIGSVLWALDAYLYT
ncbi:MULTISPECIES: hypothetical protein [unclassified Streptomyces]|uniref:hypothetical protein n=1 Tax=unclassified Streptomyces TaxID=2593676 RepID=UPI003806E018